MKNEKNNFLENSKIVLTNSDKSVINNRQHTYHHNWYNPDCDPSVLRSKTTSEVGRGFESRFGF